MSNVNDVVLTSRVRLARNVVDLPFPNKLNDKRAGAIASKVFEAVSKNETFDIYKMSSISEVDGNVLREKHLISPDLLVSEQGAAIINEQENISIMINEEDHIREQCILTGLNLEQAFNKINVIDDAIASEVKFSYDARLGYLTSCPTNLGTGMRASAMMFLPGLSITRNLEKCVNAVARLNMTIRGIYGEGSGADGYLYQISNQKTLGISEQEILEAVKASIGHIAEAEFKARRELLESNENALRDQIMRAWGIITNAYSLDSKEFMKLLALVKLGSYYGFIKITATERLDKLFSDGQPASIVALSGKQSDESARDIYRAAYVAKTLLGIVKK